MNRKLWLACACTMALLWGCSDDGDTGGVTGPAPLPTGSASCVVYLDSTDLGPSSTPGTLVTGTVWVVIGGQRLAVDVDVTLDSNRTMKVTFFYPEVTAGRATIVYVADLSVGGTPVTIGGYQFVNVTEGDTAQVDGTGFLPMEIDPSYTVTSGAPVFSNIVLGATSTNVANVTISGTVSNMDFDHLFIFVNGNSFQVAIDPNTNGTAAFNTIITLDAGSNSVTVVAMNSAGELAVSSAYTVRYNVQGSGKTLLGTLVWDTPTSDMDFHMWYYAGTAPDLSTTAQYHCAFWSKDVSTILPNGTDSLGNLDVDDTEGEGPEHMTFVDYPDGYYVFAVNSYSLDGDDHAYCTVTLSAGRAQRTMSHTFVTANSEDYTTGMDAWVRCFDVRVVNGVATILDPNPSFVYHESSLLSKRPALAKSLK